MRWLFLVIITWHQLYTVSLCSPKGECVFTFWLTNLDIIILVANGNYIGNFWTFWTYFADVKMLVLAWTEALTVEEDWVLQCSPIIGHFSSWLNIFCRRKRLRCMLVLKALQKCTELHAFCICCDQKHGLSLHGSVSKWECYEWLESWSSALYLLCWILKTVLFRNS